MRLSSKTFEKFQLYHIVNERIAEIFYPERLGFLSETPPDFERYTLNFDNEPARLRRDTANMYGSYMRPRGREWFNVTVGEDDEEIDLPHSTKTWLEDATKRQRRMIYRQRALFTEQMALDDADYVTFGSSCSTVELLEDQTGIVFRNKHLKDVAWCDDIDGAIGHVFEKLSLEARFWPSMFVGKAMPKHITDANEPKKGDPYKKFPVIRCVMKAEQWEWARNAYGRLPPARARWASVYLCPESKQVMSERWLTFNPYHIRRWSKAGAQPWGTSIITPLALGDARVLNRAEMSICEAIEKLAEPPLVAKHEAVLGAVNIGAGGVTMVGSNIDYKTGRPIEVAYEPGNPAFGMEYTAQKRAFLSKVFLENPLKLPLDREMTLGEVNERIEEISRAAAPVFEPGEADNQRVLEKVFQVGLDMRAFLPPPEELQGAEVRFELDTLLTQAIDRLRHVQAQKRIELTMQQMQVDPHAARRVDWAAVHKDTVKGVGPQRWSRDPDEVAEEIAQDEEQQAQMDVLAMAAEVGKSGAVKSIVDKALEQPDPLAGMADMQAPL